VLLTLELGDRTATTGKHQNGFVVAHQFAGGLQRPDDNPAGGEQVSGRAAHPAHATVSKGPHPGADRAPHQIRDQEGFGTALGVVAHQQESPIAGQVLDPVDIRPVEVHERSDPIGDRLRDAAPSPDPPWLIHDRVDVHRGGHDCPESLGSVRTFFVSTADWST
jgi:hypothetical protein